MKYQKLELNHFNLHLINTDKFKKTILSVCFKKKINKNELTKRVFLTNILTESSKVYKTPHDIQIKCEDLYELGLDVYNLRSGKVNVVEVNISMLDEKYTEANMFKESVDFLYEILYNPNIKNKKFDSKSFNRVKKYLNDDIKSIKDNPNIYSFNRMIKELDESNMISYDINMRDLNKIDESNLYDYYLDMINNEEVDIFLIGNITDEMVRIIIDKFKLNNPKPVKINHSSKYQNIKLKEIKESSKFTESTLRMAYTFSDITPFENMYVMPLLNYILGGSQDSLLFSEIREKESLCYSIYSSRNQLSEVLDICAGINKKDYKKVKKLVLEQVDKIKNGNFTNKEIINGKKYYENSCLTVLDSLGSILNMYKSIHYVDSDYFEKKIEQIKKVTKKDIISLAHKMHLSIIFLLEGDNNE